MIQDAIRDVEDPFLMPITNESESNGSHERFPIPLVMVAGKANRIQMKLPISMMFFRQISQMIASFGIYTITSYLITRNLIVALIFRGSKTWSCQLNNLRTKHGNTRIACQTS